jgi:branched-chain amino acid transport system permease protein
MNKWISLKTLRQQITPVLIVCIACIILLAIVPFFTQNRYFLHILILSFVWGVVAASYDVLSLSGQYSLGHAAFFGIAAYVSAFLTARLFHFPPVIAFFASVPVCLVASLIIGIPCLRLKGPYLTIATFIFAELLGLVATKWFVLTGGEEGISAIPTLSGSIVDNYYIGLIMMVVLVIVMYGVARSPTGKVLKAIGKDETVVEALGGNITKYKLFAFAFSAIIVGISGNFYAHYYTLVDPQLFSINFTATAVAMTAIGGIGTIIGPIGGAFILYFSLEYLRRVAQYRLIIYSIIIVLIMKFQPRGVFQIVVSAFRRLFPKNRRRAVKSSDGVGDY